VSSVGIARQLSVWADFNALDAEHRITTSLRFADSAERPAKGELIRLYDDEGNSVNGVVEEVHDLTIRVRPVMETWMNAWLSIDAPFPSLAPFLAQLQNPQEEQHQDPREITR
jgi:hypothetical protein